MLDNKTRLQRCINLIRFSCAIAIVICVYFYFMCTDYFTFFVRQFYRQDAKYDMFLSPKINKFSTRQIFACLYSPVVKIWFIRARKVLEEFEGEYDFWLKTNSSIFCQNSNKEKQNKLPLGMMKTLIALGTMLFEATFGIRVRLSWRQKYFHYIPDILSQYKQPFYLHTWSNIVILFTVLIQNPAIRWWE